MAYLQAVSLHCLAVGRGMVVAFPGEGRRPCVEGKAYSEAFHQDPGAYRLAEGKAFHWVASELQSNQYSIVHRGYNSVTYDLLGP